MLRHMCYFNHHNAEHRASSDAMACFAAQFAT
jgi:hypothetical protein